MKKNLFLEKFLLLISVIIIFYIFYRSEIYHNGLKRDYYKIYYILSLSLFSFSLTLFFIKKKIRIYILIILISSIFALYLFEAYLSYGDLFSKKISYKIATGNNYDVRSRFEFYNDQIKNNKTDKIVMQNHPSYFINEKKLIPFSGISNALTIQCNENGYFSKFKSDRYGFNNPDNEWDQEEIEYLLTGDSFTQGNCVNRPNDIASVLRTLSGKSVLNLGSGGNGPLIEYAVLREYLFPKVKNVVWIFFEGNDLSGLKNEIKSELLNKYIENLNFTQNLKKRQVEINDLLLNTMDKEIQIKKRNKESQINNQNKLFNLIKLYKVRHLFYPHQHNTELPNNDFEKILRLAKDLSIKNNSNFYFVYLPRYSRYVKKLDNKSYENVKQILKELDIEIIDIHESVFKNQNDPLNLFPFRKYGHYNELGYKLVAEKIFEKINELQKSNNLN